MSTDSCWWIGYRVDLFDYFYSLTKSSLIGSYGPTDCIYYGNFRWSFCGMW